MIKKIELYVVVSYLSTGQAEYDWIDISTFIEQGMPIKDTVSGVFDSGSLVFSVPGSVLIGLVDTSLPLTPKIPLRYREVTEDTGETLVEYLFETSDCAVTPLRTRQVVTLPDGEEQTTIFFYSHEVNFVELSNTLTSKFAPNFSVVQPKNIYTQVYQRSTGWAFITSDEVRFCGNRYTDIPVISANNDKPDLNNSQNIMQVGSVQEASVRINTIYEEGVATAGIAIEDYTYSCFFKMQAGGPQIVNIPVFFGAVADYRFVYPTKPNTEFSPGYFFYDRIPVGFQLNVKYYNQADEVIAEQDYSATLNWYGDNQIRDYPPNSIITDLKIAENNVSTDSKSIIVERNPQAAYVIITPSYSIRELQIYNDAFGPSYGGYRNTSAAAIPTSLERGYNKYSGDVDESTRIPYRLLEFNVSLVSSAIKEGQLDIPKTLLEVADKALVEVNLKYRQKFTYSARLRNLLDTQQAPENTFEGYSFKDLLVKLCRVVGAIPILGDTDLLDPTEDPLTTISYVKPGEQSIAFDFQNEEYSTTEAASTLDEFYDVASATLQNLISESDSHTEQALMQAAVTDFSQITQENAGFIFTYPIYFIRQFKIKGLAIPFTYTQGNTTIAAVMYGNDPDFAPTDEANQTWDFTSRCFEEDIYGALPDVNYNTPQGRQGGYLSKANTIYYKSGEMYIRGLGHTGPNIPDYDPPFTADTVIVPDLALVECAIVLGYISYGNSAEYPNFSVAQNTDITIIPSSTQPGLLNVVATLNYTALNNFTYRSISNDPRKAGQGVERRVHAQDKVLSLQDTAEYIGAEQNKQGNIIYSPTLIYPNVASCLKTGYKVNDGYVITTRNLKIFNRYVECSYELTKSYVLQDDNIKLDIMFERYAIPYDYVEREVLLFTYLVLSYDAASLTKYVDDPGATQYFNTSPEYMDMLFGAANVSSEAYAKVDMTYTIKPDGTPIQPNRSALVKMHLVNYGNTFSYIGKMVDNYSAGNQVFYRGNFNYVEPFRYCDSLGKVETTTFTLYKDATFNLKYFPDATRETVFSTQLVSNEISPGARQGDNKDAREAYTFNVSGCLQSENSEGIFVYSTGQRVSGYGFVLSEASEITVNTKLEDLQIAIAENRTSSIYSVSDPEASVREYRIDLRKVSLTTEYIGKPIVLWSTGVNSKAVLRYILKDYTYEEVNIGGVVVYRIKIYAAPTRYGLYADRQSK